jgi:hypothetical protein
MLVVMMVRAGKVKVREDLTEEMVIESYRKSQSESKD